MAGSLGDPRRAVSEGIAKDVFDLNKKYDWADFISYFVQDLEMRLANTGVKDKRYHQKWADYCRALLPWCSADDLIVENTRRGMADSYFDLGETDIAEAMYKEWIEDDPDWGWGYIGWSDFYHFDVKQYDKSEALLLAGYAREELRDKDALLERLVDLYEDMGKPDKAKEY